MTPDKLLDNTAAAEMLSVSPKTLVAMRERGEIPFVPVTPTQKGVRYSARALSQWIGEHQQTNASPTKPVKGAA